jgi:thioredoxin-like negative regulator of GroEL
METNLNPAKSTNVSRRPALAEIQMASRDNFDELVLRGDGPIAVEFMSYSCGHCQKMEPVLKQVAARMKSKAKVFQVDLDADSELGARYGVQGTPTFVMFFNGKEVGKAVGPSPIVANVQNALSQPFGDIR